MNWLLLVVVALPLLGSGLLLAIPDRPMLARPLGISVASVDLILVLTLLAAKPWQTATAALSLNIPWVPSLAIQLRWQLDGLSLPLLLLTAALGLVGHILLPTNPGIREHPAPRNLVAALLAVQAGATAAFLAADLIVFFIAFEMVLIPMWAIIRWWGAPHAAEPAARRFIVFTALGSGLLLAGMLTLSSAAQSTDIGYLAQLHGSTVSRETQILAAGLMLAGLAMKIPLWPVHTWLPLAHSAAPTVGSILLAGVLLKLGSYGVVRLVVSLVPQGFGFWAPGLAALAIIAIFWGAYRCLTLRDLKLIVAYSSISHMGFITLGIASGTAVGLQGALFGNVAHGLITTLLFVVAGGLKDRKLGTFEALAGLRERAPRLGGLLAFGTFAGLGLPGLAGFWGEFMVIYGTWQGRPEGRLGWQVAALLALLATALTAGYGIRLLRHCWHGESDGTVPVHDARRSEWVVGVALVGLIAALGLWPGLLLSITELSVKRLTMLLGTGVI
ncbi:MAG: complex I subunit 4 family protein [Angustibacter sp.]